MADEFSKNLAILEKLLKKKENIFCADCHRKSPSWASTTFGVFVCIKCSGFHRELGTHITKVRSVNLDKWKQDDINVYQRMNNEIGNKYWEKKLKEPFHEKLQNDDYKLNQFIVSKYVDRKWASKSNKDPAQLIREGKDLSDDEEEEEKPKEIEEDKKKVEVKKKFESIDYSKKEKPAKVEQKVENLIDFSQNSNSNNNSAQTNQNVNKNMIEWNEFESAPSVQSNQKNFKNNSNENFQNLQFTQNNPQNSQNSSLIDLTYNQKDNKLKEITSNIDLLYDSSQQAPKSSQIDFSSLGGTLFTPQQPAYPQGQYYGGFQRPMGQFYQPTSHMNPMGQPPQNFGYPYGMPPQQGYIQYRPNFQQPNPNTFGTHDLYNKNPQQSMFTEVPKFNSNLVQEALNSNSNQKKDPFSSLVNFK